MNILHCMVCLKGQDEKALDCFEQMKGLTVHFKLGGNIEAFESYMMIF